MNNISLSLSGVLPTFGIPTAQGLRDALLRQVGRLIRLGVGKLVRSAVFALIWSFGTNLLPAHAADHLKTSFYSTAVSLVASAFEAQPPTDTAGAAHRKSAPRDSVTMLSINRSEGGKS